MNVFAAVTTPKTIKVEQKNTKSDKLNVLIFGIDSVSKSNFLRNMPLTYKVLMGKLGGWTFQGIVVPISSVTGMKIVSRKTVMMGS